MTAILLEGHATARAMIKGAAVEARLLTAQLGRPPCLAVLSTPEGSASAYRRRIGSFAEIAKVSIRHFDWPMDGNLDATSALIRSLNYDDTIDGVLPLAPFPSGLSAALLVDMLSPAKDVDGLTADNAGRLARGLDGLFPCTPQAALRLAEDAVGPLRGLRSTVVGASPSVGRPLAEMLLQRGVTVTMAHIDTRDLAGACRTAELLFVAAGKPGLIRADCVTPGATVIDIGINIVPDRTGGTRIVGDVDLADVRAVAHTISAVPDGVGPLTTAVLIRNTLKAAALQSGASRAGRLR